MRLHWLYLKELGKTYQWEAEDGDYRKHCGAGVALVPCLHFIINYRTMEFRHGDERRKLQNSKDLDCSALEVVLNQPFGPGFH